jgi:hypothetical protein
MNPKTLICLLCPILWVTSSFSQRISPSVGTTGSDDETVTELVRELVQAVRNQRFGSIENLLGSTTLGGNEVQIIERTRAAINGLNHRMRYVGGRELPGTFDFAATLESISLNGDSASVRLKTGFLGLRDAEGKILEKVREVRFVKMGGVWRLQSFESLLDALEEASRASAAMRGEVPLNALQSSASGIMSSQSAINLRFVPKTLEWNFASIDEDGDGIITENDAMTEYGKPLFFSPEDIQSVYFPDGEGVHYVLDNVAGFIAYLTTGDNTKAQNRVVLNFCHLSFWICL